MEQSGKQFTFRESDCISIDSKNLGSYMYILYEGAKGARGPG